MPTNQPAPTTVTPEQVAVQITKDGGSATQAAVGAALVSGIESDGSSTELAGGVGPAAGLFQFEPETWLGNGGGAFAPDAQNATWQDQVQVFVNATKGDNFGDWGPDVSGVANDYGYSGPVVATSKVGKWIAAQGGTGNIVEEESGVTGQFLQGFNSTVLGPVDGALGINGGNVVGDVTGAVSWTTKFGELLSDITSSWNKVVAILIGGICILIAIYILFHSQINSVAKTAAVVGA